jgi:iron(III) transport system permease protein
MVFIVVIPLAIVIVQGFISAQRGSWAFTLSHVALVLGRWPYWAALLNTFVIGIGATAIACAAGIPMAWLFARTNLPGKAFLEKLATIPISRFLFRPLWARSPGSCWRRPASAPSTFLFVL